MSAQIFAAPSETFLPVNQTLMYSLQDSGGSVASTHRFIVQVFEYTAATTEVEIAKLYVTANTVSKAYFDLSAIVKERVKLDTLPMAGSTTGSVHNMSTQFSSSTQGVQKYKVSVGTFNGTSESLAEATKLIYVVQGAEQISAGLFPSFAEYYPTSTSVKGMLTDRWADGKIVSAGDSIDFQFADTDEGCLATIQNPAVVGGATTLLHYQLYSAAGVIATQILSINGSGGVVTPSDPRNSILFTGIAPMSLRFPAADLPSANPTWISYTLWFSNTNQTVRYGKWIKVLRNDGACKNIRAQIAFVNSVGGWDYLAFDGNAKKTETTENKPYTKSLGNVSNSTYTFAPTDRTTQAYQVTSKMSYNLKATGFTPQEYTLVESMMKSDNVMMRYGTTDANIPERGKWLPVMLKTNSLEIQDKQQTGLLDISIDVELAQEIRC